MEAEIAGFLGTLVGAFASIGTTFLSNRHAVKLQSSADAIERQEKARAFQRDTLLACQEMMQVVARLTVKAFHEGAVALNENIEWTEHRLSEQLDEDIAANRRKLSVLIERVADDELRKKLKSSSLLLSSVSRAASFDAAHSAFAAALQADRETMELLGNVLRKTY